ncbi:interleukin-6 [Dendropsophus ebraccatus]|uniref:interleukin-6 n=1 Tax=Dendropsophus ebraccatus TaxID=150705 RepID=UPI0038320588
MDYTSTTSSAQFLVYLAITAMLPIVQSAPTHLNYAGQTKEDLVNVATVLVTKAGELSKEICRTSDLCFNSAEHLLRVDLKLPEIDMESGCLSKKFQKEKCLPKISSDLLKFQIYLEFLTETMPSKKAIIEFMQVESKHVANAVKHLEENPSEDKDDTTTGITKDDLRSKYQWNQTLTSYTILSSFQKYMEYTVRAVRYSMNVSK